MHTFRQRIGLKLFVLLAVLVFFAIVPLAHVVFSTVSYFGTYSAEINREQIEKQTRVSLATIAGEQARRFETFFSKVAVASSLMAAQAEDVYDNITAYSGLSPGTVPLQRHQPNGLYYSSPESNVITAYWGEDQPGPQALREVSALSRLDGMFREVSRVVPESLASHMITLSGIGRYHSLNPKARKSVWDLPPPDIFDLRDGEPVMMFRNKKTIPTGTRWTRVYKDDVIDGLMITASTPVVDTAGRLRAITGIDLPLETLLDSLVQPPSLESMGEAGGEAIFAFILDGRGQVIAFPENHFALFGIDLDVGSFSNSSDIMEFHLADSQRQEVVDVLPKLIEPTASSLEVKLDADVYILTKHSLPSLDWRLVLVTRQAELFSSVTRTEEALSGVISLLKRKYITNTVLIVTTLLVFVFLAVGYFVAPLKRLSEAALRVGGGELDTRCRVDRDDELGILADSFNSMVAKLEAAEAIKRDHARSLEQEVAERTRDLRNKNYILRDVIGELNTESERRKKAVEALRQSEQQIRIAMDASLAGHGIVQDMKLQFVNPMAQRIFGYSWHELIDGELNLTDLIVEDQQANVVQVLKQHFEKNLDRPFIIECLRKDGTLFEALVGGAPTTWQGKPAMVVTFMDVSEQIQAEEQIRESRRQLQKSLAEKEVLLKEIYHRTKNNMLVIISMLNLQALDIHDQQIKTIFQETENRIRAMSLVHEKLYQSQNLAEVNLGQYLDEMITSLVRSMVIDRSITVDVQYEMVAVSIDNTVPLGLAVNEIVMNSIKHAFPQGQKGSIYARIAVDSNGMVEVVVGDDGVGLPPHVDVYKARSFGLQITTNLIETQLRGTLAIQRDGGTVYTIHFKEPVRPTRI